MINSIKITDLHDAENIARGLKENNCNAWICTIDKNDFTRGEKIKYLFNKRNIPCHLDFFYDFNDNDVEYITNPELNEDIPRKENVQKIINFLDPLVDSEEQYNLGINCFAGVSRSTAIGIISWVLQGYSPKEALDKILEVRWMAYPNTRLLRFASEICGIDMVSDVHGWIEDSKSKIHTPSGSYEY